MCLSSRDEGYEVMIVVVEEEANEKFVVSLFRYIYVIFDRIYDHLPVSFAV